MINKIKEWFSYKYGIEVKARNIWMVLTLLFLTVMLLATLVANYKNLRNAPPDKAPPGNMNEV